MKAMSWLRAMGSGLFALLVVSCGGSGGGDEFSVSVLRNVNWSYLEGLDRTSPMIGVTWNGTPPGDVYFGVSTPNDQADPNIEQVPTSYRGEDNAPVGFRIIPNANLTADTYNGTLVFLACKDELCKSHYAGSPANVTYSFTVGANLHLNPQSLSLTGIAGTAVSGEVAVALPAGVTSYTAVPQDPSVTVSNLDPTGFRVTAPARNAGTYDTVIAVRSGQIGMDLPLRQVASPRVLTLDRYEVDMSAVSPAPATARVAVLQLAEGSGSITAVSNITGWLTVSDVSSTGFTLNARPLPAGVYRGRVDVRSGTFDTATVMVTHTVTGASGSVDMQPFMLTLSANPGSVSETKLITMTLPAWNPEVEIVRDYSSGSGWLRTVRRPDNVIEVSANAAGLAPGTYYGAVGAVVRYPADYRPVGVHFTVGGVTTPASAPSSAVSQPQVTAQPPRPTLQRWHPAAPPGGSQ